MGKDKNTGKISIRGETEDKEEMRRRAIDAERERRLDAAKTARFEAAQVATKAKR